MQMSRTYLLGLSSLGVPRGCHAPPHILAYQLTLSQPRGGQIIPTNDTGIPGFSDLPTAL